MGYEPKHLRAMAGGVDRRQFLRRAAVVGTTAWAVPTIVSVDLAGAQHLTSPPPAPPPDVGSVTVPPAAPSPDPPAGTQVAGRTTLPRTGMEIDDLAVAGLALIAGGAALRLWSAELER